MMKEKLPTRFMLSCFLTLPRPGCLGNDAAYNGLSLPISINNQENATDAQAKLVEATLQLGVLLHR